MTQKHKMTNEATFEAHLGAALLELFPAPGIQVTHQLLFSVRLGHHGVSVDGKKDWKNKGRLDVLLSVKTRPVAILELKRPGLDLKDATAFKVYRMRVC